MQARVPMMACGVILSCAASAEFADAAAPAVTVKVVAADTHPISPYIYGINLAATREGLPHGLTLDRAGGNRWTTYNWRNNASNAGSDYNYQNDTYLSSSSTPAEAMTSFIKEDRKLGMASVITFQMQGWVAADTNGPVKIDHPPDVTRFDKVIFTKKALSNAPFTTSPPRGEAAVYMDELIWTIDQKFAGQDIFGKAPRAQPVFAELDNEPELWNATHREVQGPTLVSAASYIARTIALATALKTQFPDVVILGPSHYGFYGIYAWNNDLKPSPAGHDWFPDHYLPEIKAASARFGKPLVDVYDFHWYPEATDSGGKRVTQLNDTTLSDDQVQAIVQSPRSLWDASYQEKSWIVQGLGGPINILNRLQARIDAENPGMRLSITEYNTGGTHHIAGTLAQADYLGVFGAQKLFAAALWPMSKEEPYTMAGFRAFRDFDGAGHNFGDTSVHAVSDDVSAVSAYVSTDSAKPGRVVMVLINRSNAARVTEVVGELLAGTAHLFQMTAASAAHQHTPQPVAAGTQAVSGPSLRLTLPALSVTTVDVY